jgi:tubulin--tyrosine ligase
MKDYYQSVDEDIFENLPLTFHVKRGLVDPELKRFEQFFYQFKEIGYDLWIVKPGENSNRGVGVHVLSNFTEIKFMVANTSTEYGTAKSYIIQKYIERPLLVHKRKFDIRTYGMITAINGCVYGYFYKNGYLRTSSKEFTLSKNSRQIHLTNDAV